MSIDLSSYNGRIAYFQTLTRATKYLEIGVSAGNTFLNVDMPLKIGVDPNFAFDTAKYEKEGTYFFKTTSDHFFECLDNNTPKIHNIFKHEPYTFDIIFIDGLHTFQQSYDDFKNSLRYSHDNTIWLIDDVLPYDSFSALPDQAIATEKRNSLGLTDGAWHGDVYKTIFAIHDSHPEISYCTLMSGNPQTVLWKKKRDVERIFSTMKEIESLSFYEMLVHIKAMMPINDSELEALLFTPIKPIKCSIEQHWREIILHNDPRHVFFRESNILHTNATSKSIFKRIYNKLIKMV